MPPSTPACHPASLPIEKLLAQCEVRRQRRSGPGGQHRNKVETAIVMIHRPTGLRAEASERRSQAENQKQALLRLRVKLAVEIRHELREKKQTGPSPMWRTRCAKRRIRVSETHEDYPSLLAEALDACLASEYDLRAAADWLGVSSTQLLRFIGREAKAWTALNEARRKRGLPAFHRK